ncbi:hypothetical protein POL68_13420 [Stigmatella sp. ncwal1]|uniref:Type III effector n=1 Tax=Stigmatella ashevillensis TaxID=2995309 RepID=A0ABT5D736_9BACT|nr:hypothetical protein [Stigmatella ashevillena]MDC0709465.1 hypothetical protein [Stigmatella ashevillena]
MIRRKPFPSLSQPAHRPEVAPQPQRRNENLAVQRLPVESVIAPALQQGKPSATAAQRLDADEFQSHPEYPAFKQSFQSLGMSEPQIQKTWDQTLKGVMHQQRLRDSGQHGPNPHFEQVAQNVAPHLKIEQGHGPLALWSGGYDVSKHAQMNGHTTLESTPAGRVFSGLELYKNPKAVTPLWNHLSEKFVQQNPTGEAHVFMRTHDPRSTLYQQEVPNLKAQDPNRQVTWHPVHTDSTGKLQGIQPDLTLGGDARYSSEQDARTALKNYGTLTHDEGIGAQAMKLF